MTDSLRTIGPEDHYEGLGEILSTLFVIPSLKSSVCYDRLTSFFTTESLISCADGIDALWDKKGKMRLLIGLHSVPLELAEAASDTPTVDGLLVIARKNVIDGCKKLTDEAARNRIGTLALMLREGFLEVRVAAPINAAGKPSGGILHSKRYIFTDAVGDKVVGIGSPNETSRAMSINFEEITVHTSWDEPRRTKKLVSSYERMWCGLRDDLVVRVLDKDFAEELLAVLKATQTVEPAIPPIRPQNDVVRKVVELIRVSPEFAFINTARAALFPHQERALRDAVSRWPLRVLLADEVGLGKTIEAGSVLSYARRHLGLKRVLILTPAGLRRQWQAELHSHFGIESWIYESDRSAYLNRAGSEKKVKRDAPLDGAPDVIIVSWQLARGAWHDKKVFEKAKWVSDLILVDEAHAARRNKDMSLRIKSTKVWKLVEALGKKCNHIVLLTATPMQIQVEEYHGLLMLLGMPEWWMNSEHFIDFLSRLEGLRDINELDHTKFIAEAVAKSMLMFDSPIDVVGKDLLSELERLACIPLPIPAVMALRNKGDALKKMGVMLTPPAALTVRNTRKGLEGIGYKFPKRNFFSPPINLGEYGIRFLRRVDVYLEEAYGRIEQMLGLTDGGASAFVRSIYYQRMVSSLTSADATLKRRAARLEQFLENAEWSGNDYSEEESIEEGEDSETTEQGSVRMDDARNAAGVELQYIKEMLVDLSAAMVGGKDAKLTLMREIVKERLAAGDAILVFSRFTDTVMACISELETDLQGMGVGFGKYTGGESWVDNLGGRVAADKNALCDALRNEKIKVVFCSDAASEGLNLQTARCIINVDVPWNPARLEQRIGRISRLGQKAAEVDIYNLWYPGTIEEQMYSRLLKRQDLYSLAVGEFPEVVGETVRRLLMSRGDFDLLELEGTLNELRQKSEFTALRRIWSHHGKSKSLGWDFREKLFSIIERCASSAGRLVGKSGTRIEIETGIGSVMADSIPGQPDSLTIHHEAMKTISDSKTVDANTFLSRIFVLFISEVPICLLNRSDEGYSFLGAMETLELLEFFALEVGEVPLGGRAIGIDLSDERVIAALREAFPARIEIGEIRIPDLQGELIEIPRLGVIKVLPLADWNRMQ